MKFSCPILSIRLCIFVLNETTMTHIFTHNQTRTYVARAIKMCVYKYIYLYIYTSRNKRTEPFILRVFFLFGK